MYEMKNFKNALKKFVVKNGAFIASCAFAFVAISANTSCALPFYEPKEPENLKKFKKFSK